MHQQADVSVVMIHNGEEYSYYPSDYQVTVNQVALDAGANYILGGHPHYVQPFFRENKQQVGWYSHGNFLHGQYDLPTKVGAIGEVTFLRDSQGEISIENLRLMPTFCIGLPETWYYKVVPLADLAEYGMDGSWMFEEIKELMQTYTEVEVVEYLD